MSYKFNYLFVKLQYGKRIWLTVLIYMRFYSCSLLIEILLHQAPFCQNTQLHKHIDTLSKLFFKDILTNYLIDSFEITKRFLKFHVMIGCETKIDWIVYPFVLYIKLLRHFIGKKINLSLKQSKWSRIYSPSKFQCWKNYPLFPQCCHKGREEFSAD